MAADAIFAQLQLGTKFDTKKWKKQIELFEGETQPGSKLLAAFALVQSLGLQRLSLWS